MMIKICLLTLPGTAKISKIHTFRGSSWEKGYLLIFCFPLQQTGLLSQQLFRPAPIQKPSSDLLPFQYQRHPAVYRLHGRICRCCQDHETVPVFIMVIAACHEKHRGIQTPENIFLLPGIPFIEPRCWDHNPPGPHPVLESRLIHRRFTSRIEDDLPLPAAFFWRIPRQPPAQHPAADCTMFFNQDRGKLCWVDITC